MIMREEFTVLTSDSALDISGLFSRQLGDGQMQDALAIDVESATAILSRDFMIVHDAAMFIAEDTGSALCEAAIVSIQIKKGVTLDLERHVSLAFLHPFLGIAGEGSSKIAFHFSFQFQDSLFWEWTINRIMNYRDIPRIGNLNNPAIREA